MLYFIVCGCERAVVLLRYYSCQCMPGSYHWSCLCVAIAHVVWILHLSGCLPVSLHSSPSQIPPGHFLNSLPLHVLL